MKATWFENRELITLYTDPAYFGADVPDSYQQRPSKPVPVRVCLAMNRLVRWMTYITKMKCYKLHSR